MEKKTIQGVAAVIEHDGEILCVRRGPNKRDYIAYKWEFPGGKLEEGESEREALNREIKEELKVEIDVMQKLMTVDHEYPDFQLVMHAYACLAPHRNLTLTEHTALEWRRSENLSGLDWAAADVPIVECLKPRADVGG